MKMKHALKTQGIRLAGIIVLAAMMMATAAPGLAGPTTPITLRVQGPATAVQTGQSFTALVYADNADNLGSFEFQFVFDSTIASTTAADISLAGLLGSTGRNTGELRREPSPPDPNRAIFGAYSYGSQAGPSGDGLLATAVMTATAAGTSTLTLEQVQVTDIDGIVIASETQPGSVTVTDAAVTRYPLYLPVLLRNRAGL